ncbi:MAG: cation diffusion facilitator family transporter [Burkholderiaceae bacterium]
MKTRFDPSSSQAVKQRLVCVSLLGSLAIALMKFAAAGYTGSSAMVSEGVHSLVDLINEILLLYGMRRASKLPDLNHPLGYGRELYFWSFIVTLLVLAFGSVAALYIGIGRILNPTLISDPLVNYLILAGSFVCEAASGWLALKEFRKEKGSLSYFDAFQLSKDPATFIVVFEGIAAIVGILIAALGIGLARKLGIPQLDGVASIGIGLVLGISSILLLRETKALLIGEAARPIVRESILQIARGDRGIASANGVLTVQMGPNQVIAALSAEFRDELNTTEIEDCVNRIESAIQEAHLDVTILFVKPQTSETWARRRPYSVTES